MRRKELAGILTAACLMAGLLMPASASAVLTNGYGMTYAGKAACLGCHSATLGDTTHGRFATTTVSPGADYMWPAGRPGVGELLNKDQVAFTLGAGTGLREYLVNNPTTPVPVQFVNIDGNDRYETSLAACQNAFSSADTVVIARGDLFPDAMGGASLAGAVNGPVLLTRPDAVPGPVMSEIQNLGATKIYVLGSEAAISAAVFDQLDAAFGTVVRLGGATRYETAKMVADETIGLLGGAYGGNAFMATGENFPDALGASPISFKKGMPLVLVKPTGEYSLSTGMDHVKILGSTDVVPASVETALGTKFDGRISGADRYATSAAVAEYGITQGMTWDGVGMATGITHPDALSGGPLLGSRNSVMLLTPTASLSADAAAKLTANKDSINTCYFIGGVSAISMTTRDSVRAILTPHLPTSLDPFVVPSLEWNPIAPDTWEMGEDGIEMEAYTCNPCHQLGSVSAGKKPTAGNFVAGSATATINAWVTDPTDTSGSPEKYVAGASIQCEVCHGTGTPSGSTGLHMGTGVQVINDVRLLDSQVCGQCHGSYKAKSLFGYTPDQNINLFVTPRPMTDVPSEASFTASPSSYRFYPNGENKGDKHSYYTEWGMSAHSRRGAETSSSPRATAYQQTGAGHFDPKGASTQIGCLKCHTGEGYAIRKGLDVVEGMTLATATAGVYGQECADCHIPHDAGTDNGMAVRSPDTTPTLLGVTMTSICEDCHNYQLEMLGQSVPTTFSTPGRDLTSRGGYSHPTREIFNGVGMFDVPPAGKFMPGVKCYECHMPATRSDFPDTTGLERYADQSFKRYTHRMFIMEPGDAKDWGLAPWGDSCSPCHAGQTQDELQAKIETWQDDAAAAAVDASAAYADAYTRPHSATEDTKTLPFKALMGRAFFNFKNYTGEGSMGAHNPEYIVDGLNKAAQLARSVDGTFTFVTSGPAFPGWDFVAGTVTNGDGTGAAGATIQLTIGGSPTIVTADANGNFSYLFDTPVLNSVVWKRCSDPAADLTATLP